MAEKRKYFWLKLKKDFFKRHDIRVIEGMDNGKDYVLFYLKLLVESIDHDGNLRFNDMVPYDDKNAFICNKYEYRYSPFCNPNFQSIRTYRNIR